MVSILGAGGAIGPALAKEYTARGERVRLVGRNPKAEVEGTEPLAADLADPAATIRAVEGTDTAFLLVGLKYDTALWRELWPRIMTNSIEACKRAGARLVFFDNVYMYGKVDGWMTEETPYRPRSGKGEIRSRIAFQLVEEMAAGRIRAMIARAADFYGPHVRTGIPNLMVFDRLAAGSRPMWPGSDRVRHSFTYTPDASRALAVLAASDTAWNQVWHLPTAPDPLTGREFVERAAAEYGRPAKCRVLAPWMMRAAGWFNGEARESVEMMYQYESEYLFDSSRFTRAFGIEATPYAEGIRTVAHA